ncbi:MacS family sensor histidine kinase [Gordonia terrae]|uniref:Two-component histidine kinase n=1 Tax=Gordonia terrae NBRC 100016 TaxID=1089454 RepID=A0ABQ0HLX5_9ACTN|nr:ATP-binding protein [Gordonia terrae]GAB46870.1 putative two-component histidine kinase [Gordonia terrae NBRC 100016]VTR08206.1 signal transduction histidine kinase [Clostridioides difficile]VTS62697.1 Signal transduction histidine kinase [Gordonia terrae]
MTRRPLPGAATEPDRTREPARPARVVDHDPVGPLWRGAQIFRLLSYLYALGFQIAVNPDLDRSGVAWVLFGLLSAWTLVSGIGYFVGFARNRVWVGAEVVVVCALMLSTSYVAGADWAWHNQTWPTTLWATNAVISVAILTGPVGGIVAGLIVGGTSTFVKGELNLDFGRNATIIVIVATGMAVGLAAANARRVQEQLSRAARIAAAAEERERLSREVHDGVLQVLALIARRGREIGGPTDELATLAAEQERALRRLISDTDDPVASDPDAQRSVDLAAALRVFGDGRVSVSAPADPVMIPAHRGAEIRAAVVNALDNVVNHAGPGARAYILVEDLGSDVVVSVRDDGIGIPDGRLAEAVAQGRVGVSKSIVGRIESLGGTARLDTETGAGTEWEFTVPRDESGRSRGATG